MNKITIIALVFGFILLFFIIALIKLFNQLKKNKLELIELQHQNEIRLEKEKKQSKIELTELRNRKRKEEISKKIYSEKEKQNTLDKEKELELVKQNTLKDEITLLRVDIEHLKEFRLSMDQTSPK